MGCFRYPGATRLLITADGGGSNGYRVRLWKKEVQSLVDELGITISVCHFPPGTSKWNNIEHQMFSFMSKNWRGRPLDNLGTIVNLISNTTTQKGLKIEADSDDAQYEKGLKVGDDEMAQQSQINTPADETSLTSILTGITKTKGYVWLHHNPLFTRWQIEH